MQSGQVAETAATTHAAGAFQGAPASLQVPNAGSLNRLGEHRIDVLSASSSRRSPQAPFIQLLPTIREQLHQDPPTAQSSPEVRSVYFLGSLAEQLEIEDADRPSLAEFSTTKKRICCAIALLIVGIIGLGVGMHYT